MDDREPTIRSRELGDGLRKAMECAGLNGKATAQALGWSQTRLSRVLTGKRGIPEADVASFLTVCKVREPERARLLKLCQERTKQGWWQQYRRHVPQQLIILIEHETKATRIASFAATTMPDLLQTGDYTTALLRESRRMPAGRIPTQVAASLARQNLFSLHEPPRFTFFIHEFALRLPVGGPVVMSGQLHHLQQMTTRPNVTIRVIPRSIGSHPGIAGSFTLLEVSDFRPVVYLESDTSCLFLDQPEEIAAYRSILDGLDGVALSDRGSSDLTAALATELYAKGRRTQPA